MTQLRLIVCNALGRALARSESSPDTDAGSGTKSTKEPQTPSINCSQQTWLLAVTILGGSIALLGGLVLLHLASTGLSYIATDVNGQQDGSEKEEKNDGYR